MWFTQVLCLILGFLIGKAAALMLFLHEDKKNAEYAREIVVSPESFCENGCKYYQEAYENFKDPDDAWKWLDDHHCSRDCPVIEAQIILFEQEHGEKKKVNV